MKLPVREGLFSFLISVPLAVSITAAHAQTITWDMPNEYPSGSVQGDVDRYFAERLYEKTDGAIRIEHHFGGALGFRSADQLDAVADGAVPIANTFIPPLSGLHPIFLLSALPFLVSSVDEARVLQEVAEPYYNDVLEDHNQLLLYSTPWAPSGIWANKPVASMEALEGLEIRTYDASSTTAFNNAGASPVQLSGADIVPQLGAGAIEAVLTSIGFGLAGSFDDYVDHFTDIVYDTTVNLVTINRDEWEQLSPEHQDAVMEAAAETEAWAWENIREVIEEDYDRGEARGVTVVRDVDPDFRDHLVQQAQPVIDRWVERMGADGEHLLEEYRSRAGH